MWWLCGDKKLCPRLLALWRRSCTLVQLLVPLQMFQMGGFEFLKAKLDEHRRIQPG